jgi:hypothetical protein
MRRRVNRPSLGEINTAGLVYWIGLIATAALILLIGPVGPAQAHTATAPAHFGAPFSEPHVAIEEQEEQEEREELETAESQSIQEWFACEELEDEAARESCENKLEAREEHEGQERTQEIQEKCGVSEVDAHAVVKPASGVIHVLVRYSVFSPAAIKVAYKVRGRKGGTRLGHANASFSGSGSFHDTLRPGKKRLARVLAARTFSVQLQAADAPGWCADEFSEELSSHRGGLVWSEAKRPR